MTPKSRPVPVLTAKMRQRFEEFVDPLDFCGKLTCDEHALNGLAGILLARSDENEALKSQCAKQIKENQRLRRLLARFRSGRPR